MNHKKLLVILFIGLALVLCAGCTSSSNEGSSTVVVPTTEDVVTEAPTVPPTPISSSSKGTISQQNAIRQAESYLRVMAFSRQGLIDQLEFGGFTPTQAVYGVDNCAANWNEQAAESANSYLKTMAFSRQGLIDQLEFGGFTPTQAVYGVEAVGL